MWELGKPGEEPGPGLGTQGLLGWGQVKGDRAGPGEGSCLGAQSPLLTSSLLCCPPREGQDHVDGMGGMKTSGDSERGGPRQRTHHPLMPMHAGWGLGSQAEGALQTVRAEWPGFRWKRGKDPDDDEGCHSKRACLKWPRPEQSHLPCPSPLSALTQPTTLSPSPRRAQRDLGREKADRGFRAQSQVPKNLRDPTLSLQTRS